MFPRRFDLLAGIILDEVGSLTPDDIDGLSAEEKRSLLIQRAADRLAERYRFPVEGRSLEERVAAVTDVLHLIGGFAEWLHDRGRLRDSRLQLRLRPPHDRSRASGCQWHVRLLTQLLQWPVRHEVVIDGRVAVLPLHRLARTPTDAEEGLLLNA